MNQLARRLLHLPIAAALVLLSGCGGADRETTWPQFRGPGGNAVSTEVGLPTAWEADGSAFRWRFASPYEGLSSPIVAGSRIFLTGERVEEGSSDLRVFALSLESGELEWESSVVSRERESFPQRSVVNSPAGMTPATDGELVFADFGTHLVALDFDGELLWSREIQPDYLELMYYGAGSSLVLTADSVIVFRDRERLDEGVEGWIAAFDKATGESRWRIGWEDTCCSFTTPMVVERAERTEVVAVLSSRVVSWDAATGEEIWRRPITATQPVSSPALEGDLLCVATGAHQRKQTACWQLDADGTPGDEPLWHEKWAPGTGSPLLYDGLFFILHENGFLRCQDARGGKVQWQTRLPEPPYHASLVAGDGKIYAVSRGGRVSVFAAGPGLRQLADNELPDINVLATPAIADGCLIVRTAESVLCIEDPNAGSAAASDRG